MKLRTLILFFLMITTISFGQEKKSKGDVLFFEYAYKQAIREYQKELRQKPLTNQQFLNLADAYLKTGDYERASETYLDVYKKDSTMSNHYFNKMLQSLSKTSGMEKVKAFLATKSTALSEELLENADFNFELLGSGEQDMDFAIFNINGNSPQSDFSPTFYADKLLFTSARKQDSKEIYAPSAESYLDIFVARIEPDGNVLGAKPFTAIPNSKFHQATPYYSKELDNIFYILSNAEEGELSFDKNGKNALSIGMADEKGSFKFLLKDLSTSFYYPFYEAQTGKLYFAANFGDGHGGTDIYYVYTNKGQIMSAPINLGPRINTPGNEIAPFIFDNSLYFASDIFYGLGGMDIYRSNIQPGGSFSVPINLGKGINSAYDDFGFVIKEDSADGLLGYFSSNREGGKGNDDIYGFKVKEKPGLKTLALRGRVLKPNSNQGVAKTSIKIFDADKNLIKEVYTKEEGEYQLEIPWRDSIILEASKERYSTFYKAYGKTTFGQIQKGTFDIQLTLLDDLVQEKEGQTVIKLNKFYFNRGKSDITPEIALELDKVVNAIKEFPQLQLRIESHTDSRGGSSTNFKLSQNRSDAMKRYLVQNGVPSKNILYSVGYGEDKILNNCKNGVYCLDMLHQQNERSLVVVLNYDLLY